MPRRSSFVAEAAAVFLKDWRTELRTRYALNAVALFAVTTLVVVSLGLGPLGAVGGDRAAILPVLLWLILLFAASAGLPRSFAHEEETHTATALRLAARPAAVFCGKLLYSLTLILAIETLVAPLFAAMLQLPVESPGKLVAALAVGGYGLAAASTLVAAIVAQARGKGALFAVLSFPVLTPVLLLAMAATRTAVGGGADDGALLQALLYDASVTVGGLMLFPPIWNP